MSEDELKFSLDSKWLIFDINVFKIRSKVTKAEIVSRVPVGKSAKKAV